MAAYSYASTNVKNGDDTAIVRATGTKSKTASLKAARIRSAVSKGKQTQLPSETGGNILSKFDHHGRAGRLSVYAEEANHKHSVAGRFKVITAFKPANSIHNQLFFGETSHKRKAKVVKPSSRTDKSPTSQPTLAVAEKTGDKRQTKPVTFEELIVKFKAQRQKNQTGKEHLERLELLDAIYKRKKEEWKRIEREFSSLGKVRTELNKHEVDLDQRRKAEERASVKLPGIKVSQVRDVTKKKPRKQNSKGLKIPKERIGNLGFV